MNPIFPINRRVAIGIIATSLTVANPTITRADSSQPLGIIRLESRTVKAILEEGKKIANEMMDRASFLADRTVAHGAAELSLILENLRNAFGETLDKGFNELNKEEKSLFLDLNHTIESIESRAINLEDAASLNVMEAAKHTWLAKPSLDFYISRIDGCVVADQEADFPIAVKGLGFGFHETKSSSSVIEVSVGDKPLAFSAIRQEQSHVAVIHVPNRYIRPLFSDDKIASVPLTFKVTNKGFLGVNTRTVTVPIIVLPRNGASIKLVEFVEKQVFGNPREHTIEVTRRSDGEPEDRTERWTCGENQRIISVEYVAPKFNAGFCYSLRYRGTHRAYDADFDITNGGKTAVVFRHMGVLTCYYNVKYETLTTITEERTTVLNSVMFNTPIEIHLSPDNKNANFRITGTTFDKKKIFVTNETMSTDTGKMRVMGVGKIGDHSRLILKLVP